MLHESKPNKIRMLLVEDEEILRLGVSMLLCHQPKIQLIDSLTSFDEALSICKTQPIDLVLLDLYLETGSVANRIPELLWLKNSPKVLIFTSAKNLSEDHVNGLMNGANGVIMKDQSVDLLIKAIESVHAGEFWINRKIFGQILRSEQIKTQHLSVKPNPAVTDAVVQQGQSNTHENTEIFEKLSSREKSIAVLAIKGMTAKQIADQLGIAEKTVRNNLTGIYVKLSVASQLELCLKLGNQKKI